MKVQQNQSATVLSIDPQESMSACIPEIQDGQARASDTSKDHSQRIQELNEAIEYQHQMGMTEQRARLLTASHIAALDKEHTQTILKAIASMEGKTLSEVFEQFGLTSSD
ncbi:hypothetical protein VP01_860g4 [Puccinia sorghi]|uniref:Uncharacterized protein n=1 Tax=Puccinia sorghi TaxID=27349 RepID=A0A0L6U8W4_9BASI|nr:hypothetical protein VP01_860g4 [Puccinia sorghi]